MTEDAEERTRNYLHSTEQSLRRLKTKELPATVSEDKVRYVLDLIKGYSKDAKHYLENKKPITSLACIAYAEGLLDALKFLGLADA